MKLSKNEVYALAGITFLALLIIILTKGRKIMEKGINYIWDQISEKRIQTLNSAIQDSARIAINELDQMGIKVRVTRAYSTFQEQEELYAKGRTAAGSIVTNAKGGESYHNYGLALDVVEMKDGITPLWVNPNWETIAKVFKKYGFEWGGDFTSIVDKPHFQKTFGYSTSKLLALATNTGTEPNLLNVA